jgi:hypothetical protein
MFGRHVVLACIAFGVALHAAASCAPTPPRSRLLTASNCFYDVSMNEGIEAGTGAHAARTGTGHPVTRVLGSEQPVVQASGAGLWPSVLSQK